MQHFGNTSYHRLDRLLVKPRYDVANDHAEETWKVPLFLVRGLRSDMKAFVFEQRTLYSDNETRFN